MNTFVMLLGPPLVAALLAMVVRPYRRFVGWVNALLSLSSARARRWSCGATCSRAGC